jgi:hypothetical protein
VSDELDDSYEAVFRVNARLIRSAALKLLRREPGHIAALIDVPDGGPVLVQELAGFPDTDSAWEALRRLAAEKNRRVYLVNRRPNVDLRRPSSPDVVVEWEENGIHGHGLVPG